MDNNLHSIGSSSVVISQLANAEEHKSINGGNTVASQNNLFRDDFVVEPFNKSSHNLGFTLAETLPMATEIEGKSTSFKDDDGDDDVRLHTFYNMAENSKPLGTKNDHRLLTSEKSTASTSNNPFSDSVDVHLNKVSNGMVTSTSPYSDSVDANLNIFVHNKGELSYDETNHLSMAKDSMALTPISPSRNVVDVRPSNNTPHGSILIVEGHKSLTTQKSENQSSSFSSSLNSPFNDPFSAQEFDKTIHLSTTKDSVSLTPISPCNNDVDVRPLNNIPQGSILIVKEHKSVTTQNSENQSSPFTSSLNSSFNDPFVVKALELSYDKTNHLSAAKDSMPLSPNSTSSNVVDVRPLNNTPQSQMLLVEEHKSLNTQNTENQILPSSLSLNSPFHDPFGGQECKKPSICGDISNECQPEVSQLMNSKPVTEVASNPCSSKTSNLSITDQSQRNKPVMEGTTTPKYRIPSHVFAREKSNAHGDQWSAASNESLFSIQMGNSFTANRFSLRSGEFNANGDNSLYSQKFNYSSKQYVSIKSGVDMETIDEVSKDQEKPRISHESTISTKSFQFPILTDIDKCNSINITASPKTLEQQTDQSPTLTAPKPVEAQRPEANASPQEEEPQEEKTQPKATPSWFNLFSCCSCRH